MFIKTIRMENFVPYYGRVEARFPAHDDRNMYLIIGDNGYGKTSLLKAVNWAFFGGKGTRHNDRNINSKAVSEGSKRMSVTVVFEEEDETYELTREYQQGVGEELTLGGRRIQKERDEAQDRIREIFPEHTAPFFIFEGEMIRELAKAQGQEKAKSSIEILLGLQALRNAVDDLGKLEKDFRKEIQQAQTKHDQVRKIKEELSDLGKKLDKVEGDRERKRQELRKMRDAVRDCEEEMEKVKQLRPLVEKKKRLEEEIKELKQQEEELMERRKKLAKDSHLLIILSELQEAQEQLQKELTRASELEKQVQDVEVRQRLLETSISDNRCALCGHSPVDKDKLSERRQQLSQKSVSTSGTRSSAEVKKHLELVQGAYQKANKVGPSIEEVISDIDSTQEEIKAKKGKVEEISEELKGFDDKESETIRGIFAEATKKIGAIGQEIEQLREKQTELRNKMSKKERELKRHGAVEEKLKRCVDQRRLAEACQKAFEESLQRSFEMNRERILKASNDFFKALTNKPQEYDRFEFATGETYAFQLVRKDGYKPDMDMISDGEKEIVALSFVLGLSKYSQVRAPLIMDSVNSRLDGIHRCNLVELLNKLDNQVILLGIDRDFDWETRQRMADAICQEYKIVRKDDEYSLIEERKD